MKKITILLFAIIMSFGAIAQNELLFDGSAGAPGQALFRQGPSWGTVGSVKGITDDGSGTNNVIEITRSTNAGAAWHVLPLVDGAGQGVNRSIGDGGTYVAIRLRVRTTKSGDATLAARLQNTGNRTPYVTVTGGDGTNFGAWQTIVLNFSSLPAENKRPEFFVDPFDSATTPPAAAYQIQFDDIEVIDAATLSAKRFESSKVAVYPNPTRNEISISTQQQFNSVKIYDVVGKTVKSFNNTKVLNVSDLNVGLYFLKTDTGLQAKFVKN